MSVRFNSSRYCDRKARARSCVSATNRCTSGESAVARAIADRSDSSSSFSAYAVSFGSSTFIFYSFRLWFKRDEISGDLSVTLSQRLQCSVEQHSNIISGRLHDLRYQLVTEIVLEFELNHFLLPNRKGADDTQQEAARFLLFQLVKRHRLFAFARFNQFFVEVHHAPLFSTNVKRHVSANCKQPGCRHPG